MTITLDARFLCEREQAHKYLKEQFSMPDYYGCNMDALYDCISDRRDLKVVITHSDDLDSPEAEACYHRFLGVLCDACDVTVKNETED